MKVKIAQSCPTLRYSPWNSPGQNIGVGSHSLGRGVSLHGCSNKAQLLFLTLDEGYLFTATVPGLQRGIAPLGSPVPAQPLLTFIASLINRAKSDLLRNGIYVNVTL